MHILWRGREIKLHLTLENVKSIAEDSFHLGSEPIACNWRKKAEIKYDTQLGTNMIQKYDQNVIHNSYQI